ARPDRRLAHARVPEQPVPPPGRGRARPGRHVHPSALPRDPPRRAHDRGARFRRGPARRHAPVRRARGTPFHARRQPRRQPGQPRRRGQARGRAGPRRPPCRQRGHRLLLDGRVGGAAEAVDLGLGGAFRADRNDLL
ncbi:MAG: Signal peptidase I, partial [uncultured Sphingomonadaceae bacterium]